MIRYDTPTPESIAFLADNAREVDVTEGYYSCGTWDFPTILRASVAASEHCLVASDDEGPVSIFGVTKDGEVWMIGTDRMARHARALVRKGRHFVTLWAKVFGPLHNVVLWRNTTSIRWLRHLGFTVHTDRRVILGGAAFHPFDMSVPNV